MIKRLGSTMLALSCATGWPVTGCGIAVLDTVDGATMGDLSVNATTGIGSSGSESGATDHGIDTSANTTTSTMTSTMTSTGGSDTSQTESGSESGTLPDDADSAFETLWSRVISSPENRTIIAGSLATNSGIGDVQDLYVTYIASTGAGTGSMDLSLTTLAGDTGVERTLPKVLFSGVNLTSDMPSIKLVDDADNLWLHTKPYGSQVGYNELWRPTGERLLKLDDWHSLVTEGSIPWVSVFSTPSEVGRIAPSGEFVDLLEVDDPQMSVQAMGALDVDWGGRWVSAIRGDETGLNRRRYLAKLDEGAHVVWSFDLSRLDVTESDLPFDVQRHGPNLAILAPASGQRRADPELLGDSQIIVIADFGPDGELLWYRRLETGLPSTSGDLKLFGLASDADGSLRVFGANRDPQQAFFRPRIWQLLDDGTPVNLALAISAHAQGAVMQSAALRDGSSVVGICYGDPPAGPWSPRRAFFCSGLEYFRLRQKP